MTNNLTTYVKHVKETGFPTIGFLGWYSVSDSAMVDVHDMIKVIKDYDAPMKPPAIPKMADVFRRACNEAQKRKVPTDTPGHFVNYNLQDLGHDESYVYRMIVAERVDARDRKLGYKVLAKARFDRETSKVEFIPEPDETTGDLPDLTSDLSYAMICQEIVTYIETRATIVSTIQIRESIRKGFEGPLKAIPTRGGVYFVDNEHAEALEAMDAVANSFDGVSIHMVPLLDDEKQLGMVKEAFEDESIRETERLLAELKELNDSHVPVSARKFTDIKVRCDEQKAKVLQYKKILGDNQLNSEVTLGLVDALMVSILETSLDG